MKRLMSNSTVATTDRPTENVHTSKVNGRKEKIQSTKLSSSISEAEGRALSAAYRANVFSRINGFSSHWALNSVGIEKKYRMPTTH